MVSDSPTARLTFPGVLRGFADLLPVALFSMPFGVAFGVVSTEAGLSPAQTIFMSAVVFSGAAQFAALDNLRSDIDWLSLALVVLAVSARHVIMGAALSGWIMGISRSRRFAVLAWLSDANFARAHTLHRQGERDIGFLLGSGLALWANWVAGSIVGALAGEALGNVSRFGFDVVLLVYFASIVTGEGRRPTMFAPIVVAVAVAVLSHGFLPAGWNVILAAFAGGTVSLLKER